MDSNFINLFLWRNIQAMQSINKPAPALTMAWCHDPAQSPAILALFMGQLSPHYISHGELQSPRAIAPGQWSPQLADNMALQIEATLAAPKANAMQRIATAHQGDALVGIAFVSLDEEQRAPTPFAPLDDLVVSPAARGQGLGQALFGWVCAQLRAEGLQRLFLESGIGNHGAHRLFERLGCQPVSVTMMKELGV